MKIEIDKSFQKDLRKLNNKSLNLKVAHCIESMRRATSLREIASLKKLKGGDVYYRIRVGEYRLGLEIEGSVVTFVRCLNRKKIYQYFPK